MSVGPRDGATAETGTAGDAGARVDSAVDTDAPETNGTLTIDIEAAAHHLGDGAGAEGLMFQKIFTVDADCVRATIELDTNGANLESPPRVSLNAMLIGTFAPFFPPVDEAAPEWQTNATGTHDYNAPVHVTLDASAAVVRGDNTFLLENGTPGDDYEFSAVVLVCEI